MRFQSTNIWIQLDLILQNLNNRWTTSNRPWHRTYILHFVWNLNRMSNHTIEKLFLRKFAIIQKNVDCLDLTDDIRYAIVQGAYP